MPACHRCGKSNQPKVEVRQTARGFVCKDRIPCAERQRQEREQRRAA